MPLAYPIISALAILGLASCSKEESTETSETASRGDAPALVPIEAVNTSPTGMAGVSRSPTFPRLNATGDQIFFEGYGKDPGGQFTKDFFISKSDRSVELISLSPQGQPAFFPARDTAEIPQRQGFDTAMDALGNRVAFEAFHSLVASGDGAHVNLFVRSRETAAPFQISLTPEGKEPNGHSVLPFMSGNGECLAFISGATDLVAGDLNGQADAFLYSIRSGKLFLLTNYASQSPIPGEAKSVSLSSDCKTASLYADDSLWLMPLDGTGEKVNVTSRTALADSSGELNYYGGQSALDAQGRRLAFTALSSGVSQIFLWDRDTGIAELVSHTPNGEPGDGDSVTPSLSEDGRFVAFDSSASNLVEKDTNQQRDVFVYDRRSKKLSRVSVGLHGEEGEEISTLPHLSGNGGYVVFVSKNRRGFPPPASGDDPSSAPPTRLFRVGLDYFFGN
ncbi:MAG: hypothetical protein U1F66_03885 [bacterium]